MKTYHRWNSGKVTHACIQRIYERGDWVVWRNLPIDGSVRWRKPL